MRISSAKSRRYLLEKAYDCGIRHFDVARMYGLGQTEAEVGAFAAGKRDQLIIATKFGIEPNATVAKWARFQRAGRVVMKFLPQLKAVFRKPLTKLYKPKEFSAQVAQRSLEVSLKCLQTDYVDLFLLHEPTSADHLSPDLLEWLERARTAGQIKQWGLAGDVEQIGPVRDSNPGLAPILQFPNDIVNKNLSKMQEWSSASKITFSPFSRVIGSIRKLLAGNRSIREQLSEKIDLDVSQSDNLTKLLLSYCVRENSRGVSVFFTSDPRRLEGFASCIAGSQINETQINELASFLASVPVSSQ